VAGSLDARTGEVGHIDADRKDSGLFIQLLNHLYGGHGLSERQEDSLD